MEAARPERCPGLGDMWTRPRAAVVPEESPWEEMKRYDPRVSPCQSSEGKNRDELIGNVVSSCALGVPWGCCKTVLGRVKVAALARYHCLGTACAPQSDDPQWRGPNSKQPWDPYGCKTEETPPHTGVRRKRRGSPSFTSSCSWLGQEPTSALREMGPSSTERTLSANLREHSVSLVFFSAGDTCA